jgi:hypothetical protein
VRFRDRDGNRFRLDIQTNKSYVASSFAAVSALKRPARTGVLAPR